MEKVYFAGGCFWCIASCFDGILGVNEVISGYSGGKEVNPTYDEVKSQTTGHRETIEISYDENLISYSELLDIFFDHVDPFDPSGQFIDKGFSYTLAIFYKNEKERGSAMEKIEKIEKETGKKVCLSLEKFSSFYRAEDYHQDFHKKHPEEFEKELILSKRKN